MFPITALYVSTNTLLLRKISTPIVLQPPCNSAHELHTEFTKDNRNKMVIFNKEHSINDANNVLKSNKSILSPCAPCNKIHSIEQYKPDGISLKRFVIKAHEYIENNQLSFRQYKRCIVSILWQLAICEYLLQSINKSLHVNMCPENIILYGLNFGLNVVNVRIRIICRENSLDDDSVNGVEQMLKFGMLIYYCFIGTYPCKVTEIPKNNHNLEIGSFLWAITNRKLNHYLAMNAKLKFVTKKILSLLNGLLNIDSTQRLNVSDVLRHQLFRRFI
eukprot:283984_1